MTTLTDLFNIGMMRSYPEPVPDVDHDSSTIVLNIGAGNKRIHGSRELDYPKYDAETMRIPYPDCSVDQIHCYHMLEHINNVPFFIGEVDRVLKKGAHINIVVPYYSSLLYASDPDHKTPFTERSFERLFSTEHYVKDKVEPMHVATNFIMGDCEANLCLVIQLVSETDDIPF
jgi:ubiquinone/menaquinone biosynthesis C-methylase UbiE